MLGGACLGLLHQPLLNLLHYGGKLRGYLPDIAFGDVFGALHDVVELLVGYAWLPAEDVVRDRSGLLAGRLDASGPEPGGRGERVDV